MTKRQLLESARTLSQDEQLDLVMELWDTLEPDSVPLTQEHKRELDERLERERRSPSPIQQWSDVRDQLLREDE